MDTQEISDTASVLDFAEQESRRDQLLDQRLQEGDIAGLFTLTLGNASFAELDCLIAAAFARASTSRSALLIVADEVLDFSGIARLLRPAMLQSASLRPAAVSVVVRRDVLPAARELSFELAWAGVLLGEWVRPELARTWSLRERDLVRREEGPSSSIVLCERPSRRVFVNRRHQRGPRFVSRAQASTQKH
jgi:hypothetical protein